uniref:Uncharacterized protein n=1 Tax=Spongospora subterranea TaxID=70186 RepID=A0A0H5R148_9EUKA|eukprot:CRZ01519.1 hypothetical protein [Spongospora subterranea]
MSLSAFLSEQAHRSSSAIKRADFSPPRRPFADLTNRCVVSATEKSLTKYNGLDEAVERVYGGVCETAEFDGKIDAAEFIKKPMFPNSDEDENLILSSASYLEDFVPQLPSDLFTDLTDFAPFNDDELILIDDELTTKVNIFYSPYLRL